jgi:hypothetical protein
MEMGALRGDGDIGNLEGDYKRPEWRLFDGLTPRLLSPFRQFLDRNSPFGVEGALAATGTSHREFVGQRTEILYRDERPAFRARHHAALVGGFR